MQASVIVRSVSPTRCGVAGFDPSVALEILGEAVTRGTVPDSGSAWDAAWIACLTNSPRWAETARREFIDAMTSSLAA